MPDLNTTGLDPNIVLQRWCEFECSAMTELTCQGNPDPSRGELAKLSQSMFTSGISPYPACIAACTAAMPELLARPYSINRYILEKDGYRIGKEMQKNDTNDDRCKPQFPQPPISLPVPVTEEASAQNTTNGVRTYASASSSSLLPAGIVVLLGVALLLLAPELAIFAAV